MAAAGNYKVLPPFDEKKSYESWKNETEISKLVNDLDKKKQALPCRSQKARESALEIDARDLHADTGMTVLLTKLYFPFLKEEKDRQYEAYIEFDRINRAKSPWGIILLRLNDDTTSYVSLKLNCQMAC